MARPKIIIGEDTAYQKLEKAFWAELDEKEYSKITISSLAKRANVNHNTIYYHFGSIDEMARKLFYENMTQNEIAQFMFQNVLDHTDVNILLKHPAVVERLQRAILFARGDSAYLLGIFQDAILNVWLKNSNLVWDDLTLESQRDLKFILGGITAILGSPEYANHPERLASFPNSEIGSAVIRTLAQIQSNELSITNERSVNDERCSSN